MDGEGKNAIELQASLMLLGDEDMESVATSESLKRRLRVPKELKSVAATKGKWWHCCRNNDAVDAKALRKYNERKAISDAAASEHASQKRNALRLREKQHRNKNRYARVPEGVLIYRLDTSTHELSLMSEPHSKSGDFITEMTVVSAEPAGEKSRRGMLVTTSEGKKVTLVACEQRTATAWLEAMSLMLAKDQKTKKVCWYGGVCFL